MSLKKFVDGASAAMTVALWKKHGFKVVATNGCYDILHAGHIQFLEAAKRRGDKLVVGLNTDESVRKLKGPSRPLNNLFDRSQVMCALETVDMVVPVPETEMCQFLEVTQPDLWVKGGDYTLETLNQEEVKSARHVGAEIELLPFTDGHSTTNLVERIKAQG